jgi:hypothetical protein
MPTCVQSAGSRVPTYSVFGTVAALGLVGVLAEPARGQDSTPRVRVLGVVGDFQTGDRVVGAFVRVNGSVGGITDDSGRFRLELPPGTHVVDIRRMGYQPRTFDLALEQDLVVAELRVALSQVVVALPEVVVSRDRTRLVFGERRGFYRRQRIGIGQFITRDDIDRRLPRVVSEMLHSIPGVEVYQSGIRDARVRMKDRLPSCHYQDDPLVVLDGIEVHAPSLDALVPVQFVEAIEVYTAPSEIPAEFNRARAACGVIVIWTRQQ